MPPRSGQLDQISEAIGELKGKIDGIDKYVHEWRHGVNNVSQKVDSLGVKIAGDIAGLRAEIRTDLDTLGERVAKLEARQAEQSGAKGLAVALMQSPLLAWLFAAAVVVAAWWRGER